MKLAPNCVVSLRTKSEEKLPLDNILLFLLFEIARIAIISSIWLHFLVKTPNTETPNTGAPKGQHSEGRKLRKVMTPVTQAWDRIFYHTAVVSCHTDISYRTDTSYKTDIFCLDIIYSHYNNTPSWHHIPSCWYHAMLLYCVVPYHIISFHIIWYGYFNCWYNIIHIYRSHGNNLRYQNWYYLGIKRLPLNWKFLNLLLRLECNYTSIPLHSSKYLSSQECYFRLLTVVWLLSVLTLQCFDHSVFLSITHYRPSTPLFGKIGHEMFKSIFLWFMQGLKMSINKDLRNMYSQVCKAIIF